MRDALESGAMIKVAWTRRNAAFGVVAALDLVFVVWLGWGAGLSWSGAELATACLIFGPPLVILVRGLMGKVVASEDLLFIRNPLRTYRVPRSKIEAMGMMSPTSWVQAAPHPIPCVKTVGGRYIVLSVLAASAMGDGEIGHDQDLRELQRWLDLDSDLQNSNSG